MNFRTNSLEIFHFISEHTEYGSFGFLMGKLKKIFLRTVSVTTEMNSSKKNREKFLK